MSEKSECGPNRARLLLPIGRFIYASLSRTTFYDDDPFPVCTILCVQQPDLARKYHYIILTSGLAVKPADDLI